MTEPIADARAAPPAADLTCQTGCAEQRASPGPSALGIPMAEFITIMAVLMALTALSVDVMLVVLPDIAADFTLTDRNQQQFVITVYLVAFASGHLFAGPLSDRFGRKPAILGGLAVYAVGSVIALAADSFAMLLAARVVQGLGAAGPRVVAIAVIRDRFVGRAMSRVMSFVMTVFIILPVIAPAIGSAIAAFGSWQPIFLFLFAFGTGVAIWVALRLPETNPPNCGRSEVTLRGAIGMIVSSRQTMGYVLALGFVFGCLMGYIASSQQLFADVYGVVAWFPAVFASVAGGMVVSTLVNAKLVYEVGMRRLSHSAVIAFLALSLCLVAASAIAGTLPLSALIVALSLAFFLIGLILPNFNALAMEPLGRAAGTGSSFVGFVMTGAGALLGGLVGQLYDGTVRPLLLGYLAYSATVLFIVVMTERGRLFGTGDSR